MVIEHIFPTLHEQYYKLGVCGDISREKSQVASLFGLLGSEIPKKNLHSLLSAHEKEAEILAFGSVISELQHYLTVFCFFFSFKPK